MELEREKMVINQEMMITNEQKRQDEVSGRLGKKGNKLLEQEHSQVEIRTLIEGETRISTDRGKNSCREVRTGK